MTKTLRRWVIFFPMSTPSPHLLAAKSDHASVFDREKAVEEGAAKLRAVNAEQGVSGLVDCAPYDLGRDMGLLVGLSRASGWDIVAATGIFGVWGYPAYWEGQGDAAIEEFFTREIEDGAIDEGVRCGVIKIGTRLRPHERPTAPVSSGERLLSDQDRRVLKAAARVQSKIGVPITTHTDRRDWRLGNVGLEQIETLTGAGANPENCIIGHASHTSNLGYIVEVPGEGMLRSLRHYRNRDRGDGPYQGGDGDRVDRTGIRKADIAVP